jgi:hypothetical protein
MHHIVVWMLWFIHCLCTYTHIINLMYIWWNIYAYPCVGVIIYNLPLFLLGCMIFAKLNTHTLTWFGNVLKLTYYGEHCPYIPIYIYIINILKLIYLPNLRLDHFCFSRSMEYIACYEFWCFIWVLWYKGNFVIYKIIFYFVEFFEKKKTLLLKFSKI